MRAKISSFFVLGLTVLFVLVVLPTNYWTTRNGSIYTTSLAATGLNINPSAEGASGFEISFDGTTITDLSTGSAIPAAPVTATVTLASLNPSLASPQAPGTSITWTANASGGTSPLLYRFYLSSAGTLNIVQDYSTANTWTWNPTSAGDYSVSVWVKEQNSTNQYDATLNPVPYSIASPVVLSSLTPSAASPKALGTSISWTANASGGSSPLLYRFYLSSAGTWNIAQDYSTANSWTWSPSTAGDYYVTVWVKEQNSTKQYDVALDPALAYSITSITGVPVALSSLTPNAAGPKALGTSISWTANASGGSSPLLYRFYLATGGTWNIVQDYSTVNSWTWSPTAAGNYYVTVWVKEQNSTKQSDAVLDPPVAYSIATPVVLNSLAPSVPSAQPRRTSIKWTAAASGGASPLQYRFLLWRKGSWSIVQDYSTVNTWTWRPNAADNYYVTVWVKEQNSTKQNDVALDPPVPYTIK